MTVESPSETLERPQGNLLQKSTGLAADQEINDVAPSQINSTAKSITELKSERVKSGE
jgi:hypothetical protein